LELWDKSTACFDFSSDTIPIVASGLYWTSLDQEALLISLVEGSSSS
jgi:hypothetical protein